MLLPPNTLETSLSSFTTSRRPILSCRRHSPGSRLQGRFESTSVSFPQGKVLCLVSDRAFLFTGELFLLDVLLLSSLTGSGLVPGLCFASFRSFLTSLSCRSYLPRLYIVCSFFRSACSTSYLPYLRVVPSFLTCRTLFTGSAFLLKGSYLPFSSIVPSSLVREGMDGGSRRCEAVSTGRHTSLLRKERSGAETIWNGGTGRCFARWRQGPDRIKRAKD